MPSQINQESLEKRLLDGVRSSRKIINPARLMLSPDGVLEKLEEPYKNIKDLFNVQLQNNSFLNSASIAESIPDYETFGPYTTHLVSIINISLATYKVFSQTELNNVLDAFFTTIIPSTTEIEHSIAETYSELLHKVVLNQMTSHENIAALMEILKPSRSKLKPKCEEILNKYELQCLDALEKGTPPKGDSQFIMLWSKALRTTIQQSMPIRNILISFPKDLELAAKRSLLQTEEERDEQINREVGAMAIDDVDDDDDDSDVFVDASQDPIIEDEEEGEKEEGRGEAEVEEEEEEEVFVDANNATPSLQTPSPNSEPSSPSVSESPKKVRTVAEVMESGETNPFISNCSRYRTSILDAGSYSRRRKRFRSIF